MRRLAKGRVVTTRVHNLPQLYSWRTSAALLAEVVKRLVFTTSAALLAEVVKRLVFTTYAALLAEVVKRLVFTTFATLLAEVVKFCRWGSGLQTYPQPFKF